MSNQPDILDQVLRHLSVLVACDTQNPPRAIDPDDKIFAYIKGILGDNWTVEITDHGKGRVTFFAKRGEPNMLFNVHLDTVPAGEGWTHAPHDMKVIDDKVYGRGVCDIKGAAAALLALAENTDRSLALLFTTDEEGTEGCCVQMFCDTIPYEDFDLVVVAEPTGMQAVTGHRGYLSVEGHFSGCSGHTSHKGATDDSATHDLMRWSAKALEMADDTGDGELADNRFNIGRVEGGIKPNMVAADAMIKWSMRPATGQDPADLYEQLTKNSPARWQVNFMAPSLPASGQDKSTARQLMERAGVAVGDDVAFWTEASLFSGAKFPAVVLGPGHIAQAHTIDEWVELTQLSEAYDTYKKLIETYND